MMSVCAGVWTDCRKGGRNCRLPAAGRPPSSFPSFLKIQEQPRCWMLGNSLTPSVALHRRTASPPRQTRGSGHQRALPSSAVRRQESHQAVNEDGASAAVFGAESTVRREQRCEHAFTSSRSSSPGSAVCSASFCAPLSPALGAVSVALAEGASPPKLKRKSPPKSICACTCLLIARKARDVTP